MSETVEHDESVLCSPLAVFELELMGNSLALGIEHGVVATDIVVNESAEYGLITYTRRP